MAVLLAGSDLVYTRPCRPGVLDTYELPESPYGDQGDMQEQTEDMDDEWEVHHDILQDQDNFNSAAGEGGSAEPASTSRVHARTRRPRSGGRAHSVHAGC